MNDDFKKLKSGRPIIYKDDPEKTLFNIRSLLYYQKTNNIITEEEYNILYKKYKILTYENKIEQLKEELENEENTTN